MAKKDTKPADAPVFPTPGTGVEGNKQNEDAKVQQEKESTPKKRGG